MSARVQVADFWDDVLDRWLEKRDHLVPPLERWLDSYQGSGNGAVDLAHYPDPYIGDLRGERHTPRMVLLGLNPGVGYEELQSHRGIWAQRICREGYSRCFQRSPAEDPATWKWLHGKQSAYWARLIKFTKRWTKDPTAGVHDILNFELYPWHSNEVNAPMRPPGGIIQQFIWNPVQEVDTPAVFAFGAPWFDICRELGLPVLAAYGPGLDPFPSPVTETWKLILYRLPSGQVTAVSSQQGFAGPPGAPGVEVLRQLVATATTSTPPGAPPPTAPDEPAPAAYGGTAPVAARPRAQSKTNHIIPMPHNWHWSPHLLVKPGSGPDMVPIKNIHWVDLDPPRPLTLADVAWLRTGLGRVDMDLRWMFRLSGSNVLHLVRSWSGIEYYRARLAYRDCTPVVTAVAVRDSQSHDVAALRQDFLGVLAHVLELRQSLESTPTTPHQAWAATAPPDASWGADPTTLASAVGDTLPWRLHEIRVAEEATVVDAVVVDAVIDGDAVLLTCSDGGRIWLVQPWDWVLGEEGFELNHGHVLIWPGPTWGLPADLAAWAGWDLLEQGQGSTQVGWDGTELSALRVAATPGASVLTLGLRRGSTTGPHDATSGLG